MQLVSRGPEMLPVCGAGRGGEGQSHTTESFSKSPACQRAPSSEAPPPGAPPALLFMWPSSLLSISSKETPSPPLLSGAPSAPPLPAQLVSAAGRWEGGGWTALLAVRPGMGAPGGRGRTRRRRRAGTWRIRVWGPLQVRRERWFVLLSNRRP